MKQGQEKYLVQRQNFFANIFYPTDVAATIVGSKCMKSPIISAFLPNNESNF